MKTLSEHNRSKVISLFPLASVELLFCYHSTFTAIYVITLYFAEKDL